MKDLVIGGETPSFAVPAEVAQISKLLEKVVLPSLDMLSKLEAQKKILAGGLPAGKREFIFILEASSNEEVDKLVRDIPIWGSMKWQVTPLQTFGGRADMERSVIEKLK